MKDQKTINYIQTLQQESKNKNCRALLSKTFDLRSVA
jgi:hypothetical protein